MLNGTASLLLGGFIVGVGLTSCTFKHNKTGLFISRSVQHKHLFAA